MTHRGFFQKVGKESGIGNVLVVRNKSGGCFEAGVFLVDRFCLGVKDAFAVDTSQFDTVEEMLETIFQDSGYEEVPPARARKYVESAVAYAQRLGFAPHRDYSKGARVFGGIRAADCEEEFVFGRDGKPFYIQGPYDSPEKADRILSILEAKLGKGGYDYIVRVDNPGDFDDKEDDLGFDDEDYDEDFDDKPQGWVVAFEYPRVGKNPSPELLKLIEETREMHPDMPDPEIRNDMDSIGEVLRGFFLAQDQETFTVSEALGALNMDKEEFAQLYKKLRPTLSMLLWNDAAGHPMSEQALNALPGKLANVIREMRTNPAYIQRKNELEKFLMASSNPPVILAVDSTPNPGGEHDRILAILSF